MRFVLGGIVTVGVTLSTASSLPQAALNNETKTIDPLQFRLFRRYYSCSLDFNIIQHIALTGEQHKREQKKYNTVFPRKNKTLLLLNI